MSTEPTVFVVDDDTAVRGAIGALLKSVGLKAETYASADEFLHAYDPEKPGCLVLDIRMPGTSGLTLQQMLTERGINIPIIFITGHGDVASSVRAMKAHAFDFIQKPFRPQELLDSICGAIERDVQAHQDRKEAAAISARMASLTPREHEVLHMLVDGKSSKLTALELNISQKTVDTHRANLMEKMRAGNMVALVKMVLKAGSDPAKRRSDKV